MKKKKVARILAVIAIIGVTAYLIYRRYSGGDSSGSSPNIDKATPMPEATGGGMGVFPLKRGSSGNEVRHLQRWLNSTGPAPYANLDPTITHHSPVDVDGKFGPKTEASLRQATKNMYTYVTKAYYDMKNMQNF